MGNIWTKQTRLTTSNGSTPVDDLDVIMTSHSTDEDQDDFLMDTNNDSWDYDEPYELLPDGFRRKAGQNREKKCNTYGDWIDLGNVDTGEMALTNHQGRRRCLQKAKAKDLRLDQSATAAALNDIRCSGNISPRTPHNSNQFRSSPYTPISAMSFLSGTSPPTSLASSAIRCPGIPLIWDTDDPLAVFNNYPWTRHAIKDHTLGYQFPTAKYEGDDIAGFDIRATQCLGSSDNGKACSHCRKLVTKVDHLRRLSKQPPGRLNYQYQTHDQLTQGHRSKNKIITDLRLSNLNLSRNCAVAKKHLEIDDRFVAAILSNKSTRVDQLIRVYTGQGASRSAITEAIQKASAGLLKVRSYTQKELDMAMVMFRTGGRKLVYAANHGQGLPSMNTLRLKAQITHLLPSLGLPTFRELSHNISEIFGKSRIPLALCGHSILIDEIATEERPVFIKWLNSVGGFCREHTKGLDLRITNVSGLRTLADALFGPKPSIHFAKEATVAGIAAFRSEHYEVMPIFAAGTCKKENVGIFKVEQARDSFPFMVCKYVLPCATGMAITRYPQLFVTIAC